MPRLEQPFAIVVADPDLNRTMDFCSDVILRPHMKIFLHDIGIWGRVEYLFPSEEEPYKWIVRIKTEDDQVSKHVAVRMNPSVIYAAYDTQ
jgi:hypothetical protein